MQERILFVCIGQGAGNIGQILEDKKYNCLFVNTSYDDLKTLKANHKLHIVGANGCNKDRDKALKYAMTNHEMIENVIEKKFPMLDIVYFLFTMGGGTGSGLSPLLLQYMSNEHPNKHYGAIMIAPSKKESIKSQINAIECYKHIRTIKNISYQLIDNGNAKQGDLMALNNDFVNRFDALVNVTIPDVRGIIDGAELETLLTCKGSMYIDMLPLEKTPSIVQNKDVNFSRKIDIANKLIDNINNNPYGQFEPNKCKYVAYSLANEVELNGIDNLIGETLDTFTGYNKEHNLIVFAGQPLPKATITKLYDNVKKINAQLVHLDEVLEDNEEDDLMLDDLDIDGLFDNIIPFHKKEIPTQQETKVDVMSIYNQYVKK